MIAGLVGAASAQKRNDKDIRDAVRSLNSKIDDFEYNLRYQMQSSSSANTDISAVSDDIRGLRDSVRLFQDSYDKRRENRDDVSKIVNSARRVDTFMLTNPQNRRVQDEWDGVKAQIDRLSVNYGLSNSWGAEEEAQNVKDYPDPVQKGAFTVGMSGTYDLDTARSENIEDIVADTNLSNDQREDLKDKLTPPQQIAIDIRGQRVTLATTNASPVSFTADGRDKTEKDGSGRTVRVRATLAGDTLTLSSLGGESDYTIKFITVSDGRVMKVTRRITTEYLNQTVFAESAYNKTNSAAQLGIHGGDTTVAGNTSGNTNGNATTDPNGGYSDNDNSGNVSNGGSSTGSANRAPTVVTSRPGNYVVPNGVVISGILQNEINTNISQNNDRFRMTVQSPDDFRGAVVEGYVSGINRSGKVTGQPKISFNFEKITLRNGQTYDFAGNLQEIRDAFGKVIKIDNEGTAKGNSQTTQTVKRGGIGAGIGAIIGAIAGGGTGAAIGAAIGGGVGAGSVIVKGNEDIRLTKDSTITVTSSSPMNSGPR